MNQVLKHAFVLAIAVATSLSAAAAQPEARYRGDFKIEPKVMHSGAITGQMQVLFEGDAFKGVSLKLDNPVMGLSEARSDVSWFNKATVAGKEQIAIVYNLVGPPHKWFFVNVGYASEGATNFDGTIYKVRAKLDELKTSLKDGIPMSGGRPVAPASWKQIGTSLLKN